MNESETRAELIDPALTAAGWGVVEDSRIRREFYITKGRIQPGGRRANPLKADYILTYRGKTLAAIEARLLDFLKKSLLFQARGGPLGPCLTNGLTYA